MIVFHVAHISYERGTVKVDTFPAGQFIGSSAPSSSRVYSTQFWKDEVTDRLTPVARLGFSDTGVTTQLWMEEV